MGEKHNGPFQLSLNASVKIDFQGSRPARANTENGNSG
jgi:hypothetical protein